VWRTCTAWEEEREELRRRASSTGPPEGGIAASAAAAAAGGNAATSGRHACKRKRPGSLRKGNAAECVYTCALRSACTSSSPRCSNSGFLRASPDATIPRSCSPTCSMPAVPACMLAALLHSCGSPLAPPSRASSHCRTLPPANSVSHPELLRLGTAGPDMSYHCGVEAQLVWTCTCVALAGGQLRESSFSKC
jgi:hypothetical protein